MGLAAWKKMDDDDDDDDDYNRYQKSKANLI